MVIENKIKGWRPEGWGNPYKSESFPEMNQWKGLTFLNPDEAYEAGADAMLEAILGMVGMSGFAIEKFLKEKQGAGG